MGGWYSGVFRWLLGRLGAERPASGVVAALFVATPQSAGFTAVPQDGGFTAVPQGGGGFLAQE